VKRIILSITILVFVSGCARSISQSNLYWGDYSQTLYMVKKEPGAESNAAHEKELLSIVEESNDLGTRVPPGVYAELGLFANEKGNSDAAKKYFELEQTTYPEGAALMQQSLKNKPNKS